MIPHCQFANDTLLAMDGSANDRATKRQRGETDGSDHTTSTAASTSSTSSAQSQSSASISTRLTQSAHPQAQANDNVKALIDKKYRRVSFAPVTAIHSTEWSRDEVDSGWYSKDELAVFKQARKNLVKVLKKVHFDLSKVDTTVHCLRGYEAYFSIQANKEYKLKRQMVWKAVLQEQARQRYLHKHDAMMMQLVSSHATQWARDTATELGMQDAQVALQIFLEYLNEQEEEALEDFDDCDDDDDAPIAIRWDEEDLDLSLRPDGILEDNDRDSNTCMEPLQHSSQQLHRARLDHSHNHNSMSSSSSSHYSFVQQHHRSPQDLSSTSEH